MSQNFAEGSVAMAGDAQRVLLVKELNNLNAIVAGGGGGGGSGAPDYIAYSGPPVVNPPTLQNIVVDKDGRQWQYFNGGWN